MNICFFGVGGVGGYYGTLVTRHSDTTGRGSVTFIARGRHLEAIKTNGLLLKKDGGTEEIRVRPHVCTDTVAGLPVFDVILVSVKGYDLDSVSQELTAVTGPDTIILPLMNGADIYERMRQHLKSGIILPSCLYLGTHIEAPGVIFQKGGSGQISTGPDPVHPDFKPEDLLDFFQQAGVQIRFFDDVRPEIWTKFIFIAAYALVTATVDRTIREAAADPESAFLVKAVMTEIASVATAQGVELPDTIVETSFAKANQFPMETKTSFQRDVETKGRTSEWDLFGGTVVRLSEQHGLQAPHTKKILDDLLKRL